MHHSDGAVTLNNILFWQALQALRLCPQGH